MSQVFPDDYGSELFNSMFCCCDSWLVLQVKWSRFVWLEVSPAHQGCIYLVKNIVKYLYSLKELFSICIICKM